MTDRAFARPGGDAPWQPSTADLADARLARCVSSALVDGAATAAAGDSEADGLEWVQARRRRSRLVLGRRGG